MRILVKLGPSARKLYISSIERQIRFELAWIEKQNIDKHHYFDLMSIYPNLKRVFFIHIPKCGGTSIRQNLVESYGIAPIPLPSSGATQQSIQFMVSAAYRKGIFDELDKPNTTRRQESSQRSSYLRVFVAFMVATKPHCLFILGHQRAREIATLYRGSSDLIFATVREPLSMLRSLINYRVAHTLANRNRLDSRELLDSLDCSFHQFQTLVETDPKQLVSLILSKKKPSLASYLALDEHTDIDSVWSGIRENNIYIGHITEQDAMQAALFGKRPRSLHKNAAEGSDARIDAFNAALRDEWISPYVDSDSSALYQRLVNSGIVGFWRNGGSPHNYRQLLHKCA